MGDIRPLVGLDREIPVHFVFARKGEAVCGASLVGQEVAWTQHRNGGVTCIECLAVLPPLDRGRIPLERWLDA